MEVDLNKLAYIYCLLTFLDVLTAACGPLWWPVKYLNKRAQCACCNLATLKWPAKITCDLSQEQEQKTLLEEAEIRKFGLHSFMGLLIGMFIGETLRINPVIEESWEVDKHG